jgi:hypothetical protein
MSDELPFKTRHEFTDGYEWGKVSPTLRRFLLIRGSTSGARSAGLVGATGVAHAGRCTLLLWIAGGHLPAPHQEIATAAALAAESHLKLREKSPAVQVKKLVAWLESQQTSGVLKNSYVTASLAVVVDDHEVWVWHTSPHGVMCGSLDGLRICGSDLRTPTLRQLGVLAAPISSSNDSQFIDNLSSVFCVGTTGGYEELRCSLGGKDVALIFDRASLPFGPNLKEPIPVSAVWSRDAGWNRGLAAHVVAIGEIEVDDLLVPAGWHITKLPVDD